MDITAGLSTSTLALHAARWRPRNEADGGSRLGQRRAKSATDPPAPTTAIRIGFRPIWMFLPAARGSLRRIRKFGSQQFAMFSAYQPLHSRREVANARVVKFAAALLVLLTRPTPSRAGGPEHHELTRTSGGCRVPGYVQTLGSMLSTQPSRPITSRTAPPPLAEGTGGNRAIDPVTRAGHLAEARAPSGTAEWWSGRAWRRRAIDRGRSRTR